VAPVTLPPVFRPGEKHINLIECPSGASTTLVSAVNYNLQSQYFSPPIPSSINATGTYYYTNYATFTPSEPVCSPPGPIVVGTFSVTVSPGPSTNATCGLAGSVRTAGHLSPSNIVLCVGDTASAPQVINPVFNPGEIHIVETLCPSGVNRITNGVDYYITNVVWTPPFPTAFSSAWSSNFTVKATAQPVNPLCSPFDVTIGTVTVTVTNGWVTNYSCLQPGAFLGSPILSGTDFVACFGSPLQPPSVSGVVLTNGTFLASAVNCTSGGSNGVIHTNNYTWELTFDPEWPTNFLETGVYEFTARLVGHPNLLPNGLDCGEISTNLGVVTVVAQRVTLQIDNTAPEFKHYPGAIIYANADDDDLDQIIDLEQPSAFENFSAPSEDNLISCTLSVQGNLTNDFVTLSASAASGRVRVWSASTKQTLFLDTATTNTSVTWRLDTMPSTVFIEGMNATVHNADVRLSLHTSSGCSDSANATIVRPAIEWITLDRDTGTEVAITSGNATCNPRPEVALTVLSTSVDDNDTLRANIRINLTDRLSEISANKVKELSIYVNGELKETIDNLVNASSSEPPSWPWRPYPFSSVINRQISIPNASGGTHSIEARSGTNAAGQISWHKAGIVIGWEEISPFEVGEFGGFPQRRSPLRVSGQVLNLAFTNIPTATNVDVAYAYFGNRAHTSTDQRVSETDTNSMVFSGWITMATTSAPCPILVTIEDFNYVVGHTNEFTAHIEYKQVATNRWQTKYEGVFKESAPGSLRFSLIRYLSVPNSAAILLSGSSTNENSTTEAARCYVPEVEEVFDLGGRIPGSFEPSIIRVTGINDFVIGQFSLEVNRQPQTLATYPSTPGAYYVVNSPGAGWPKLQVLTDAVTDPAVSLDNIVVGNDGTPNILSLKINGVESVVEEDEIWPEEPIEAGVTVQVSQPFGMTEMLDLFHAKYGDVGRFMLQCYTNAFSGALQNRIEFENMAIRNLWGTHMKVKGWLSSPRTIVIDNIHQEAMAGADCLWIGLQQTRAQYYKFMEVNVAAEDDPDQTLWNAVVASQVALLSELKELGQLAVDCYKNSVSFVCAPAGLVMDIADITEGNYLAVLGYLNKVPFKYFKNISIKVGGEVLCKFVGGCFAPGTLIRTEQGLRPIEDIVVGDFVLSYDEATGSNTVGRVKQLFTSRATTLTKLEFADGVSFECTPEHPILTSERGWLGAGRLLPGDEVKRISGQPALILAVSHTNYGGAVFNFEVEGTHTYAVSALAVVAHNACRPSPLALLRERGVGSALRRAMNAAYTPGRKRFYEYAYSAAHHIVGGNSKKAKAAKKFLAAHGISVNDAVNGVFLPAAKKYANKWGGRQASPGAKIHSILHTDAYYDEVNRRFKELAAMNLPESEIKGAIMDVLDAIANELLSGDIVIH
jgi:hypothetical protein